MSLEVAGGFLSLLYQQGSPDSNQFVMPYNHVTLLKFVPCPLSSYSESQTQNPNSPLENQVFLCFLHPTTKNLLLACSLSTHGDTS